ncbi:hypothetical protein M885DRAFT_472165 [Pelagophyceae sp. CCMP2097]|nr:hypothetical protein M885DRAFT_472165 [Pelagophyceae sp. CCMP2097]
MLMSARVAALGRARQPQRGSGGVTRRVGGGAGDDEAFGTDAEELFTVRFETDDGARVLGGVRRGELVRTALLRRGVSPHNGQSQLINCRGLGTCGTCCVEVSGAVEPPARGGVEALRLGLPPHSLADARPLRLACQISVVADVTLRKRAGFWGSGLSPGLANAAESTTYFGDMEFALDSKSPPPAPCAVCRGTTVDGCPNCDGGVYMASGTQVTCKACRGSGQVVCRSCFRGDPWDLEAIRERARRRPD